MNLAELTEACRLYSQVTNYDASLQVLREQTAPGIESDDPEHRAALFVWLNSWGCRQFAHEHHATTASESLVRWAHTSVPKLPAPGVLITDLSAMELRACAEAYVALAELPASTRRLPSGKLSTVTYGATGAAKTLFAMRPMAIPPWDDPIRKRLKYSGDLGSFRVYLTSVAAQLRALAEECGRPVAELPALVGRPESSPPKIIDEYNWIVISRDMTPSLGSISSS